MNTVNWLNHLLQSRAWARRSLTRSQQCCLKSAQQEVTLKDQAGNLFVVSHMGEERQVHSSLPVSGNIVRVQSTCLAFPGPSSLRFCVCHWAVVPNVLLLLEVCLHYWPLFSRVWQFSCAWNAGEFRFQRLELSECCKHWFWSFERCCLLINDLWLLVPCSWSHLTVGGVVRGAGI